MRRVGSTTSAMSSAELTREPDGTSGIGQLVQPSAIGNWYEMPLGASSWMSASSKEKSSGSNRSPFQISPIEFEVRSPWRV